MEEVLTFFQENANVKVHPAVHLKLDNGADGRKGYGLNINLQKVQGLSHKNDDLILLRIPHNSTFNIETTLRLVRDSSQFTSTKAFEKTDKIRQEMFKKFKEELVRKSFQYSETIFMTFYFILFDCLKTMYDLPKILTYYLNTVLLPTRINNISLFDKYLLSTYYQYSIPTVTEETIEKLYSFFADNFPNQIVSMGSIRQIYGAIISRCLEIPQEINRELDDCTVMTTLVPILDFVNHDINLKNAHYDIDRETNDVILILERSALEKYKRTNVRDIEIFIDYGQTENVLPFALTYGFFPSLKTSQYEVWNISFDRDFLKNSKGSLQNGNLRLFYKWFGINPVIQLVRIKEKSVYSQWYINDSSHNFIDLLLPFLPSFEGNSGSCWKYDPETDSTFTYFCCHNDTSKVKSNSEEDSIVTAFKKAIENKEQDGNDIMNMPPLAWSFSFYSKDHNKICQEVVSKNEAIGILQDCLEDDMYLQAISSFLNFLKDYIIWRIGKLEEGILAQNSIPGAESVSFQLHNYELSILRETQFALSSNSENFTSDCNIELTGAIDRYPPPLKSSPH
ncbi:cytochrome c lysine N-methyltransferase NDAI_0C01650 [Naumovozyma dairenensis CBS 421]|uniref:SET domain-containing protein n=1 Tax=Naumovozyma dairenensis (strain ATCC 10597 / BCRC 20456 / CBS 421 / NBRC 0211 / NRRL Y-12639) TaxID=1071378 RepID=G0W7R5_NAUDC|nr:hypothetical protein NDAI_0C01650 [Naumovozyma dairenensis CBS 421]CCD23826.1 hypothetical protein NDAI_0C01650 [Naumovozyma dairenensis CBS 421]